MLAGQTLYSARAVFSVMLMTVGCCDALSAQRAIELPVPTTTTGAVAQVFSFASDGPAGPGWSRPDEIARTYFHEELPALFQRTLALSADMPARTKLSWMFTGPHAGFTVELTSSKVRLVQRYYDSTGLYTGQGNYPEKVVRDDELQYAGHALQLTVVMDAHLSVQVLLNGKEVLRQACVFDVTRHQLIFAGPRTEHLVAEGALLTTPAEQASITVNEAAVHQTMLGFGGSPSIPAYAELSEAGKKQ